MSILKKGSKGKPVEDLQKRLNKQGAKPPLKVDGIFGPLTGKATHDFQKKAKLKADGQAGPLTMAALKYGGKLPEMTVRDYEKRRKHLAKVFDANRANYSSYKKIDAQIDALSNRAEVDRALEKFDTNYQLHKQVAALCKQIEAKQKEFEKLLLTDPAKAAKLVKDCEDLHNKVEALGARIGPNVVKAAKGLGAYRAKLEAALSSIKTELGNIDKVKKGW